MWTESPSPANSAVEFDHNFRSFNTAGQTITMGGSGMQLSLLQVFYLWGPDIGVIGFRDTGRERNF
jgi:hypothetical protein